MIKIMLKETGSKVFTDKDYVPLFEKSQRESRKPKVFCVTFDQRLEYTFLKTLQCSCFR